jgi:hypothetical protein
MAKKSKPKSAKSGKKSSESSKAIKTAKKAGPRSQTLPGLNKVRSQRLDNLCEAIAEDRAKMAQARADEQASIQGALKEMKGKGLVGYKHAGVELAFVPGADKLRVRLTKDASDDATAGEGVEVEPEAAEDADPIEVDPDQVPF